MTRAWQYLRRRHPALKFALVGCSGFAVDSAILILLFEGFGIALLPARCLAFVAAATSNWILNRVFTFEHRGPEKTGQWLRFITSALISAIPNIGIFYLLMLVLPETLPWIMLALSCGILAGYACNYQLAKTWVFKPL